jgi:hypothetical protein
VTDPVRPVAPREDEWKAIAEKLKARLPVAYSEPFQFGYDCAVEDFRVELQHLAAAPVPCAASPADELEDVLRTISEIAMLAASDPHAAADFYRAKLVKICNIALQARDVRAPAPTGEGARDGGGGGVRSDAPSDAGGGTPVEEAQDGTEHEGGLGGPGCPPDRVSSSVHPAARAAEQVRAQIGRVRVALLREDSQRAETLFRAASGLCIAASMALKELPVTEPTDAPPVAVSLDPHRLQDLKELLAARKWREATYLLLDELARLRGEATIRDDTARNKSCARATNVAGDPAADPASLENQPR